MAKRNKTPSGETAMRAALSLAKPVLTGQYWLLLPATVAGFLTLKKARDQRAWLERFAAKLPPELAAAFPEGTVPEEAVLSDVEIWAGRITELVRREIAGLRIASHDDGGLASEILAGDVEAVAGEVARALEAAGTDLTPDSLVDTLKGAFEPRLRPALGDAAEEVATTLARSIVVALHASPVLRAPFIEAHEEQTVRIARDLGRVFDRLGEVEDMLHELRDATRRAAGEPTEEDVEAVAGATRERVRAEAPGRFAEQLCRPFGVRDAGIWAAAHGFVERFGESIPRWFDHVPHTLERWVPEGEARDGGRWEALNDAGEVVDLIVGTALPVRVLVLGRAGFGKTTFMHWLACALAEREGAPVPLGPVRAGQRELKPGTIRGALGEWSFECCTYGTVTEREDLRRDLALASLRRGRSVLLVDGLDQISDPHGAAKALLGAEDQGRCVASCREEVGLDVRDPRWTLVVRLRHPGEEVFAERVVEPVRKALKDSVAPVLRGGFYKKDDIRHPFLLHVVRAVLLEGGGVSKEAPASYRGLTDLLGAYLRRLTAHGEEHGAEDPGRRDPLGRNEREVLGTLGLLSVTRLHRRTAQANELSDELQRFDKAVFDEITQKASARVDGNFDVTGFLGFAERHSSLVYVVEKAFVCGVPIYTFHHQLVQEYLAALGIALRVRESTTPLATLIDLVADVVSPRGVGAGARGEPIEGRVPGLSLWSMLGELLVRQRQDLAEKLVLDISTWLLDESPGAIQGGFQSLEISPLLAVRDAIVATLDRNGSLGDRKPPHPEDPVVTQFDEPNGPPGPFMVLCWEEERRRIEAQVASVAEWLLEQDGAREWIEGGVLAKLQNACGSQEVQARINALIPALEALLARQEEALDEGRRVAWQVRRYGPTLAAFVPEAEEPSWILVPHGPFVAGDVGYSDELPVRVENVESPFWIALDPVTVGEFAPFVGEKGYGEELDGPWWDPFREEARKALATDGDRREPWSWKQQKDRHERPLVGVTWFEAAAYCLWQNGSGDEPRRWSAPHRLPGEAEWEKAARGLLGRRWPWGCAWRPGLAVCELKNLDPVTANRNRSPFAVRGAAGNVWEWTRTKWKGQRFGEEIVRVEPVKDEDMISIRGGSFAIDRHYVRCAVRLRYLARLRLDGRGFRCLRDVLPCSFSLSPLSER